MRIGGMAAAVLALAASAAAVEVTASIIPGRPVSTYAAKKMAGSIFRKAGVALTWRAAGPGAKGEPRACLVIELAERTPDAHLPGALGVAFPYRGCSEHITVFLDRIRAVAGRTNRESKLLAYVLVHEIAHVLQGMPRHSDAGIMKAQWTAGDYEEIFHGRLEFVGEDLRLMRARIESRPSEEPAELNGRFGSGIACRLE